MENRKLQNYSLFTISFIAHFSFNFNAIRICLELICRFDRTNWNFVYHCLLLISFQYSSIFVIEHEYIVHIYKMNTILILEQLANSIKQCIYCTVHNLDRSLFSILKWRHFPDRCLFNLHNNENNAFFVCILHSILYLYICWNTETSYFCSAAERLEKNLTFLFKRIEFLHSHELFTWKTVEYCSQKVLCYELKCYTI